MEERASIPVSLPVSDPTPSFWQDPPSHIALHGSDSPLPASTQVIVVGSGISGATIAFELLSADPSLSVTMLEARTSASGASGRNGGHTKHASYRAFLDNQHTLGTEEAVKIVNFEYDCMKAMHEFARTNRIDCDSFEGETVDVIYDSKQWEYAKRSIAALKQAVGEDQPSAQYVLWNPNETEKQFYTPGSYGSVSYQAGSINAYAFVCGILQLGLNRGMRLYTETPAIGLTQETGGWTVKTPRGSIHADKMVVATNGYTANLLPQFQGTIVPLRGEVTVHRRGTSMPPPTPPRTYSLIYSDGYDYAIQRPPSSQGAGEIVIGGGLTKGSEKGLLEYGTTDDSSVDEAIMAYLEDSTRQMFMENWGHDDPDGRVRRRHTGIMGYTPDGRPFVGELEEKNIFICAAFVGHGMVSALFSARALTAILLGNDGQELKRWLPDAYRVTPERLKKKFRGRQHVQPPEDEFM